MSFGRLNYLPLFKSNEIMRQCALSRFESKVDMCLGEVFEAMFLLYHFPLSQVSTIHYVRLRCYPKLQLHPNVPRNLFNFSLTLCNTYTIVIGKGVVDEVYFVKMMKACMYNNLVVHVSLPKHHSKSKLRHFKWKNLCVGVLFIFYILKFNTIAPLISFYWSFHYTQIHIVLIICHKLCQKT